VLLTQVLATPGGNLPAAIVMLSSFGLGFFGFGALRLPGWARRRREQMEAIAARLTQRLAEGPADPPALGP
jgi:hypothetical protein